MFILFFFFSFNAISTDHFITVYDQCLPVRDNAMAFRLQKILALRILLFTRTLNCFQPTLKVKRGEVKCSHVSFQDVDVESRKPFIILSMFLCGSVW